MRRWIFVLSIGALLSMAGLLWAQRRSLSWETSVWELRSVFPHEVSPARYAQVQKYELDRLAAEGWELVSVTPYVYLNEERGPEGRKLAVTQTYPAYFFRRLRPER